MGLVERHDNCDSHQKSRDDEGCASPQLLLFWCVILNPKGVSRSVVFGNCTPYHASDAHLSEKEQHAEEEGSHDMGLIVVYGQKSLHTQQHPRALLVKQTMH